MQKIYSSDFKTSPKNDPETEAVVGPKTEVLNNILNFSKALEVLKPTVVSKKTTKPVEIVLN